MKHWLYKWFLHFYDKPRGKIVTFLGMLMVAPIYRLITADVESLSKKLNDRQALAGRLGLVSVLLIKSWKEYEKK